MPLDTAKLEELIRTGILDSGVRIDDVRGDGVYYAVSVVSPRFAGLSRVEQHQMVFAALKGRMEDEALDAVQLRTSAEEG